MKVTIMQQSGPQLMVEVRYDETVSSMLTKLNNFRSSDVQITHLFDRHGKKIPDELVIRGQLTLWTYPPSNGGCCQKACEK